MSHFFNVCKTTDIPLGEARMFVVIELFIGVFNVAGKFLAIDDHCPHAGASLAHGIVEGDIVRNGVEILNRWLRPDHLSHRDILVFAC